MISDAEFQEYIDWLNDHPDPETGRPELECDECGQRIGEVAAFIPGIGKESGTRMLAALHPECELRWRERRRREGRVQ